MRRRLAACLMSIAAVAMVSGCAMSPEKQKGMLIAAGAGALVGGGIGCGVAATQHGAVDRGVNRVDGTNAEAYEIGCPVGVVGGAIIGGTIGYLLAKEQVTVTPPPPSPPPPPPPPPPAPAPQERIILRGVHFDFNRYNIRPDAAPILDEAAEILGRHPDVTVNVNGYCDIIGGFAYNQRLSERRADAVARYLEGKGITANRLVTHGYGKTQFVASNATAEGRAQNRRVELVPEGQ
jgi:outer membrane protein OmpA-like peptidoglycan-associated protein